MTVSAQTTFSNYTGNGVSTVFPYTFKVLSAGDLAVYVAGIQKALGVDYTVSGVGADLGGSVTFIVPPASTFAVSIQRSMQVSRTTDYQQQGDFNAGTVNPDFDRPILMIQDVNTQLGRTIRTPADEVGTILVLPSIANRLGKYISFDAAGQPTASVGTGNDTALRTDLASQTSGGHTLVAYLKTAAETAAAVTVVNAYREPGNITRYKSGSTNTDGTNDWSAAIQAAVNQCIAGGAEVVVDGTGPGNSFYRCNSSIVATQGFKMRGLGTRPTLRFYGCHGIQIPAATSNLNIQELELFSLDALGVVDPRTFNAINIIGTDAGANASYFNTMRSLYLRGWADAIKLAYNWYAKIDKCYTINCNYGVRFFGKCVECRITNSELVVNSGTASVFLQKDGVEFSEGIHINGLLANGTYGLLAEGGLSVTLMGCVVDQIQDTAVDLTNVIAFTQVGGWIDSQNYGVRWRDLGVLVDQRSSITSVDIKVQAADGKAVRIGANNKGISIVGGTLTGGPSGTARALYTDFGCDNCSLVGAHIINPGPSPALFLAGTNFSHEGLTGDTSIQYNAFPTIASAASLTVPPVGKVFKVSGTTNVTSIAAASSTQPEREITLIFEGVLTFTDGGNLKLNGNFVTTADDVITLVCDGSSWYERGRSVN